MQTAMQEPFVSPHPQQRLGKGPFSSPQSLPSSDWGEGFSPLPSLSQAATGERASLRSTVPASPVRLPRAVTQRLGRPAPTRKACSDSEGLLRLGRPAPTRIACSYSDSLHGCAVPPVRQEPHLTSTGGSDSEIENLLRLGNPARHCGCAVRHCGRTSSRTARAFR
jgi:hypothetical protein